VNSYEIEQIKRHFNVVMESLREDIKTIAEGYNLLNEKLDTLREENEKEHKEIRREIISVWQELNTLREENEKEHRELHQKIDTLREENEKEHRELAQRAASENRHLKRGK